MGMVVNRNWALGLPEVKEMYKPVYLAHLLKVNSLA